MQNYTNSTGFYLKINLESNKYKTGEAGVSCKNSKNKVFSSSDHQGYSLVVLTRKLFSQD